jgi:glycosyltransferase involved in cell wall biosynthesis
MSRIKMIANGVDTKKFHPARQAEFAAMRERWQIPEDAKVVGFVGRLHAHTKGCDDFIRTIARLPESYWGVIAGTGPDEQLIVTLAQEMGIQHRLRLLGLVEDVREVYWGMSVFAMTSRSEPFGLAVLEAAASGLPIVALSANGGVSELVSRLGGIVLEVRDLKVFAQAIERAAVNSEPASITATGVRAIVEREFSWDAVVEEVSQCYREIAYSALNAR